MNIWDKLVKPFFVLAPMDDVTDTVFRQIVADLAAPDLFFTEFVNVDGLQSPGRERLLTKLKFVAKERPIIAQIWGKNPDNYYKTAKDLEGMGFDGIDINMGCPVKTVVRDGCCVALIGNRELAVEIIKATQEGAGPLPVSVKTRLGLNEIDLSWHELLLKQKLNALSIHGRTKKEMSNVLANWEAIGKIRQLRDSLSPDTLIVGNGDVNSRSQGLELAKKYQLDGVMIGRGIFHDPFIFAKHTKDGPREGYLGRTLGGAWEVYSPRQRTALFYRHVELFKKTWGENKNPAMLKKFAKIYINGFDGAKELREALMRANSADQLLLLLQTNPKFS